MLNATLRLLTSRATSSPRTMLPERSHLPPPLALHGDADRVIPITAGAALVERAHALGGPAELSPYPGAAHVFDFDQTRADARDASDRALSCIQNQLK